MYASIVGLCLVVAIGLYFYNNPLHHSRRFMLRRFINWFPLGMTYAFLYMGRYNLNVAKNALGATMSNTDFGWIFAAGTWTYAMSFLVNGPLVDKIGGKRGIIIAALGASLANIALGVLTYLVATHQLRINLVLAFSVVYAVNMYFQSYGAVSIIKVKAYWFHVRERGMFGAIFGTFISVGVYFAFDWSAAIVEMTRAQHSPGWFAGLLRQMFAMPSQSVDATWAVFFIPAAILIAWALLDWWLIHDTPEQARLPAFDTCDASSGQMHVEFTSLDLLKKVFTSPLLLMIAGVELTSGVFRNGIVQWYPIFAHQVRQPGAELFLKNWGFLVCMFGIVGGFAGGLISDRWFQSRRGPPAGLSCGLVLVMAAVMARFLFVSPAIAGVSGLMIVMAAIGITSLMSGTAATDFGGRKATATTSGIVDGFAYLGSGLQSACLGYITTHNWHWWPVFLMPFAILGGIIAVKIWHELPAATRKYIAEVELEEDEAEPAGELVSR
ncbi:MAG TPA: MFS transporter [Verrucomicrobiae bacterium]|nr:MFS transporter [Verrucomicrobiae bacterium]